MEPCIVTSRWQIVIHGAIDGYSRLMVMMPASNNNRSNTVHHAFVSAVHRHGWCENVRADHGGENILVGRMLETFGIHI